MGCGSSIQGTMEAVTSEAKKRTTLIEVTAADLPRLMADLRGTKDGNVELQRITAKQITQLAVDDENAGTTIVREGGGEYLTHWTGSREPKVQAAAFLAIGQLSVIDHGTREHLCTPDLVRNLASAAKAKEKGLNIAAAKCYAQISTKDANKLLIHDEGGTDVVISLAKSKVVDVARHALQALSMLANIPEIAQAIIDKECESICKFLFDTAQRAEDTDVERYALMSIARFGGIQQFSTHLANQSGYLNYIFSCATDNIHSRKLAAGLAIAHIANNKTLRMKLVKKPYKAYHMFVEYGKLGGERKTNDEASEYQRVSALGIQNLAATFDLRAMAAKAGALEAIQKLLLSKSVDIKRAACRAVAELVLHEENGRRFVMSGALRVILEMARSGDSLAESDAIQALSNLAISEENQKQVMKEGGQRTLAYLSQSRNPKVRSISRKIQTRVRLTKLRAAARMAGRLALQRKIQEGEYVPGQNRESNFLSDISNSIDRGKENGGGGGGGGSREEFGRPQQSRQSTGSREVAGSRESGGGRGDFDSPGSIVSDSGGRGGGGGRRDNFRRDMRGGDKYKSETFGGMDSVSEVPRAGGRPPSKAASTLES